MKYVKFKSYTPIVYCSQDKNKKQKFFAFIQKKKKKKIYYCNLDEFSLQKYDSHSGCYNSLCAFVLCYLRLISKFLFLFIRFVFSVSLLKATKWSSYFPLFKFSQWKSIFKINFQRKLLFKTEGIYKWQEICFYVYCNFLFLFYFDIELLTLNCSDCVLSNQIHS